MKREILCLFLLAVVGILCQEICRMRSKIKTCYTKDPERYNYFGCTTRYDIVKGELNPNHTCTPVQIWLLSRHGTRYPMAMEIPGMFGASLVKSSILKHYRRCHVRSFCPEDMAALEKWSWQSDSVWELERLTEQGRRDLGGLAARYKKAYPGLFGDYAKDEYEFRHSSVRRTQHSCNAFVDGLFGKEFHRVVEKMVDDHILQPYLKCNAFKRQMVQSLRIGMNFSSTHHFHDLIEQMSIRFKFRSKLLAIQIIGMYDNCRYEQAWYPDRVSAWCAMFTKRQLRLLEYREDLIRYWTAGPGFRHGKKLGCEPLNHLRKTFGETVNNNGIANPKVVAMFTHDFTLDMIYSTMEYNDDREKLQLNDFEHLLDNRTYRTSFLTPFAGNIVAVLQKCDEDDYKVQLLHNENPMNIRGCPDGYCDWKTFNEYFSFTDSCSHKFC